MFWTTMAGPPLLLACGPYNGVGQAGGPHCSLGLVLVVQSTARVELRE